LSTALARFEERGRVGAVYDQPAADTLWQPGEFKFATKQSVVAGNLPADGRIHGIRLALPISFSPALPGLQGLAAARTSIFSRITSTFLARGSALKP
jgi:hypothetical protein